MSRGFEVSKAHTSRPTPTPANAFGLDENPQLLPQTMSAYLPPCFLPQWKWPNPLKLNKSLTKCFLLQVSLVMESLHGNRTLRHLSQGPGTCWPSLFLTYPPLCFLEAPSDAVWKDMLTLIRAPLKLLIFPLFLPIHNLIITY